MSFNAICKKKSCENFQTYRIISMFQGSVQKGNKLQVVSKEDEILLQETSRV